MGFSMELIPLLRRCGYRYVVVDSAHVEPVTPLSWPELRYRPHVARHDGAEIVVVVRDRELSDAQESGMEAAWFEREVRERTRHCDFEPLVTTATDGDNGGWFRNLAEGANFWTAFYRPMLERARAHGRVVPTFVEAYLDVHGVWGEVRVDTGAWNTGWHHGADFTQWTGSRAQREVLDRMAAVSGRAHGARWTIGERQGHDARLHGLAEEAMWRLLRAETSCNIYWGEDWVPRAHADLGEAERRLREVEALQQT
jgi:alpha-amylase/alpha-mannosidase (GH57 family)